MSQTYYQDLWKEAQDLLQKSILYDAKVKKKGPYQDANVAKWLVSRLFISYVQVVNKLDRCYDQMIHPQKREVIGRLLDMSLGRLLELKSEIVRIELDDYCFFDNILIELKLTHDDVQVQIPKYFRHARQKEMEHRRQLMKNVFQEAERENFKTEYLKDFPEEERDAAWEELLAREERERLEREKFEEQQRRLGNQTVEIVDSLEKLKREIQNDENFTEDKELIIQAIRLIQRHERARQGRTKAAVMRQRKALKNLGKTEKVAEDVANKAAKVIQSHWRRRRRRVRKLEQVQRILNRLGLVQPSYKDLTKFKKVNNVARLTRKLQERNEREYQEALVAMEEKVRKLYGVSMEEDIVDEIFGWFQWFFEKSGFLPDYPPEKPIIPTGEVLGIPKKLGPAFAEKLFPQTKGKKAEPPKKINLGTALAGLHPIGGTALVVAGHWIGPEDYLACQMELEKRKKSAKGGDKKGGNKENKAEMKKKQKEEEKRRQAAEDALGYQLKDSAFLAPLYKADADYRKTWMDMDESKNCEQRYVQSFVKDDKCWELAMEVRRAVDEMMELELEVFKEALERDKHPKRKRKKKKAKKKKNKKGKKGPKDPTADRSLDDLFMDLFRNGIIKDFEEAYLEDFKGEKSFCAFDLREKNEDCPPAMGDVREVILHLCILPLGSWRIHQLGPLIRSVCLLGSEDSTKEYLARVICTETAAVMFDLSPANVAGKYPGKEGLKMLLHMVEKMSRALQPSVIFVNGAEKTFYKKVPKEERGEDPKRLARILPKIVKKIKGPDQVLLLGISSQPWNAKKKPFLKTYQKIILIPEMEYGSYYQLWQSLLSSYHSVPRDFDCSCLAKVSAGFSIKAITETVQNVLTAQRISRSKFDPYKPMEFLEELLKSPQINEKMREKCQKFYAGTDMPKKRAKRLEEMRREKEKAERKKG